MNLLLVFFILLSFICNGQEEPLERTDPIRLGISFSMDKADRDVMYADGATPFDRRLYESEGFRSSRIAYSAGVDLLIPLTRRLSLQTGLRYADRGFRSRADLAEVAPHLLEADTSLGPDVSLGYHFQYLGMPLRLRLQLGDRRLQPTLTVGIDPSYLMGVYRVIYDEIPEGRNETQRAEGLFDFNRFNLFPTLSVGLLHQTTDRIWTRLELIGSYGTLPVTDAPAQGRLWNTGILMGVFYSFRAQ